jgi:lipoprotein signal peptidase
MAKQEQRSYRWLFWTLAVVGLCLDQGSKYGMFAWLHDEQFEQTQVYRSHYYKCDIIPGVFQFDAKYTPAQDPGDSWRSWLRTLSAPHLPEVNHGALWGLGPDYNHFFALISVGAAIGILIWSYRSKAIHDRWLCMALGLILAGTVGNLYDRVVFLGVRDFIHVWIFSYDFPVFNIADSCLVCGATLLLLQAFFAPQEEPAVAGEQAEKPELHLWRPEGISPLMQVAPPVERQDAVSEG